MTHNQLDKAIFREIVLMGLLHDIGKFVQRASNNPKQTNHQSFGVNFLNSIHYSSKIQDVCKFHHERDLQIMRNSEMQWLDQNIYEIICEADNLSSGERRQEGGFYTQRPLESIFCQIGTTPDTQIYSSISPQISKYEYAPYCRLTPQTEIFPIEKGNFKLGLKASHNLELAALFDIAKKQGLHENPDIILKILEEFTTFLPANTQETGPDISLFDHLKTTAAIARCMIESFQIKPEFAQQNIEKEVKNRKKNRFLLIGIDVSGIQQFISHVPSKGGLKFLKAKSTLIELLLLDIVHEFLLQSQLSWTNVIYCSGGNAYILSANTSSMVDYFTTFQTEVQIRLFQKYHTQLYVALDFISLEGSDFFQNQQNSFLSKWASLIEQLGKKKKRKFATIIQKNPTDLFQENPIVSNVKTCQFCNHTFSEESHRVKKRKYYDEEKETCLLCHHLYNLSQIMKETKWITLHTPQVFSQTDLKSNVFLFSGLFHDLLFQSTLISKNDLSPELLTTYNNHLKGIWIRNHDWDNFQGIQLLGAHLYACGLDNFQKQSLLFTTINLITYPTSSTFSSSSSARDLDWYAEQGLGASRIGILAMDVDSLGQIFFKGLTKEKRTISRIATLSRFFDIFFKQTLTAIITRRTLPIKSHINALCNNPKNSPYLGNRSTLEDSTRDPRKLEIIYSGGDDLLLIGAWNDVFEAMFDINTCFSAYTCFNPHITISAGYFINSSRYPVARGTQIAHAILDQAKNFQEETTQQKSAVSLLTQSHLTLTQDVVSWNVYRKYLSTYFSKMVNFTPKGAQLLVNKTWLRHIYDILTSISIPNHKYFSEANYHYLKYVALVNLFGMKNKRESIRDSIKKLILKDIKKENHLPYLNCYIIADLLTRGI